MRYQKTQVGWGMVSIFIIVIVFIILSYTFNLGNNPIGSTGLPILLAIIFLAMLSFYKLTVIVENKKIRLIYGIGLIRINIKPDHIREIKAVKTPFYSGWGIRITSQGMLYNIQGLRAVKITFGSEKQKTVRIGTQEPEKLRKAIADEFSTE